MATRPVGSQLASSTTPPLSATTNATQGSDNIPIDWDNDNLTYLLSCLYPELMINEHLIISPRLEALPRMTAPIHLQVFETTSAAHEAFLPSAPVGTGRPSPMAVLASSAKDCRTPDEARRSLAYDLLSNFDLVRGLIERYFVLAELFAADTSTLRSLHRGVGGMLQVRNREWRERFVQMMGTVGVDCGLEARFEGFLLQVGKEETGRWRATIELGIATEDDMRMEWSETYEDAAMFLARASGLLEN